MTPPLSRLLLQVVAIFVQLASMAGVVEGITERQAAAVRKAAAAVSAKHAAQHTAEPEEPGNTLVVTAADDDGVDVSIASLQFYVSLGVVNLVLLGGGGMFARLEGWSFVSGVYFAAVTLSSVGYGDLVPTRRVSKYLWFPFIFVGLSAVAVFISALADLRAARSGRGPSALARQFEPCCPWCTQQPDAAGKRGQDDGIVMQENVAVSASAKV